MHFGPIDNYFEVYEKDRIYEVRGSMKYLQCMNIKCSKKWCDQS